VAAQPDVIPPRLLDAGDAAFTVEFGETIDPKLLDAVRALDSAIAREHAAGRLPGLIETMPTFRSLTVFFDPLITGRGTLIDALQPLLHTATDAAPVEGRRWCLPVCYEGDAAPDLAAIAQAMGTTTDAVISMHSGTAVRVYMLGFLPGFPFMGELPLPLRLPRRTEPRLRVPAGSVAIAGSLTAIYPWESPGGWHLLGRCPVPLFDATRDSPSLLAVGDQVRFEPVSTDEFSRLATALRAAEIDPTHWLTPAPDADAMAGAR
jgi:KipI family sensor histidine kinase inhibitor